MYGGAHRQIEGVVGQATSTGGYHLVEAVHIRVGLENRFQVGECNIPGGKRFMSQLIIIITC